MSKTAKGQSAADTLNLMKEGLGLTKMQKEKLRSFLSEKAEDIGMTSRHPEKKQKTRRGYKPKIKENNLRKQLLKEFEKKSTTKEEAIKRSGTKNMKHGGSVKKSKKKKY